MNRKNRILIMAIIAVISGIAAIITVIFGYSSAEYPIILFIFGTIFGIVSTASLYLLLEKTYPRTYNVAIIGFSKTGKTTLLTVLLGEILFDRIKRCRVVVKGESTINRLNANLKRLKEGKPVGATKNESRFAYKTNITMKKRIFPKNYNIEFGDFPGECSEQFAVKSLKWLDDKYFMNWAIEADAFFFVIDVSICFLPEDRFPYTINDIDTGYRAAWQHILDFNPYKVKQLRTYPISIIFTKSDIVNLIPPEFFSDDRAKRIELIQRDKNISEEIEKLSGINDENVIIPPYNGYREINHHVELLKTVVANDFRELISFFKSENPATKIIFTSAFYSEQNNEIKLGIDDVFNSIIPK
jgi:hypothetical protein